MQLVLSANGKYLQLHADKVKTAAKQHAQLAVVVRPTFIYLLYSFICFLKSLFAAVVKIILIQVIARNITGFSDIPAPETARIDFFSFGALAFDVLGAALILVSARTFFIKANEANATRKVKFYIRDVVLSEATPSWIPGYSDTPDGFLGVHVMDDPLVIKFRALLFCCAGMVFFLVSLSFLIVSTQRVLVWVPMMVSGFVMMAWSVFTDVHPHCLYVGGQLTSSSRSG